MNSLVTAIDVLGPYTE